MCPSFEATFERDKEIDEFVSRNILLCCCFQDPNKRHNITAYEYTSDFSLYAPPYHVSGAVSVIL